MTVLEAEEDSDEQQNPPRKKVCLSLSLTERRNSLTSKNKSDTQLAGRTSSSQTRPLQSSTKMLNDFQRLGSNHRDPSCDVSSNTITGGISRIATLCNLGNTCFLNSVLYTLRCTPSFLHNLHHLCTDLSLISSDKQIQTKIKTASLGRTGVSSTTSSSRSWSYKDLPSSTGAGIGAELNKPKIQVATEKLHELFMSLRELEARENCEPFQPDAFLQALRDVNTIFEGNQQQDAHELLVCLLDNIRETFRLLVKHRDNKLEGSGSSASGSQVDLLRDRNTQSESSKRGTRKSQKNKKKLTSSSMRASSASSIPGNGSNLKQTGILQFLENGSITPPTNNGDYTNSLERLENKKCFISEDFEGISLLRTTCLECETVTERKETFCDICVPIEVDRSNEKDDDGKTLDSSAIYKKAVVTSELLYDKNKYWCAACLRLNEARRSICYPKLPRLLILQLKRFSTLAGSMEKINNHMPTPLNLQCFCEECNNAVDQARLMSSSTSAPKELPPRHVYNLYSVIMHQGATMTAGHYVAYTKVPGESAHIEYQQCDLDNVPQPSSSSLSSSPHHNGQHGSDNKTWPGFLSCFGNKPNVNEEKETLLRSKQHPPQPRQQGCRGLECCGLKQVSRNENGTWLECDDEAVRVIPVRELLDKLAPNPRNSATPYLLFYVRSTTMTPPTTSTATSTIASTSKNTEMLITGPSSSSVGT